MGESLEQGAVGEADTLLDVASQTRDALVQQLLFLGSDVTKDIDGLLDSIRLQRRLESGGNAGKQRSTHSKLDRNGEEVEASLLGDLGAARNTGEVDVAGLDDALGALDGLEEFLGETAVLSVSSRGLPSARCGPWTYRYPA